MYNSSGELNSREVAIVDGDSNTLQNITDLMLPGNSSCYIAGVIFHMNEIILILYFVVHWKCLWR